MERVKKAFWGPRIIVACGLMYALVGALGFTVGQLSLSYMALDETITMNRTYLGIGFQAFIIVQGLSSPLIALMIAKKGSRFSYIVGSVVTAAMGVLLALFLGTSVVFYIIGFGFILSMGCMSAGQIPTATTLNNWFLARRGKSVSTAMMMGAVIAVFYPLVTNWLIGMFSWRAGFWFIGACALVGLIIAVVFVRNAPADVGQEVDGGMDGDASGSKKVSCVYQAKTHLTASQALKTPAFWLITITAFGAFSSLNLSVSQAGLHFVSLGGSLDTVSVGLSFKAIGGIAILALCSFLIDRVEPIRVHGLGVLLMGLGALIAAYSGSPVVIVAYYAIIGIGYAVQTACMPTELANMFGSTHYPRIIGWVLPIVAVISSFVPTIAGAIFDLTGSYVPAFLGVAVICVIGFVASRLVRIPKETEPSHTASTEGEKEQAPDVE